MGLDRFRTSKHLLYSLSAFNPNVKGNRFKKYQGEWRLSGLRPHTPYWMRGDLRKMFEGQEH